ncbi:MAG: carboxypeptidase regulatory-like domain-containing protein [bacterium]|nr:carboxypeptidase regulatory-like domain-containing protein [bacterium]
MGILSAFLFLLFAIPTQGPQQQDTQTHPVRIVANSHVPNAEVEVLYVPSPPEGLSLGEWERRVAAATPIRTTIPRGVESTIQLPAGDWLLWTRTEICKPSPKRLIRMPRSKPEFAVRFWLPDDPGVRGQVVDANGKGIPDASVRIFRWDSEAFAVTELGGVFDFPGAQLGKHCISVEAKGYAPIDSQIIEVPRWGGLSGIRLSMQVESPEEPKLVSVLNPIHVRGVYKGLCFEGEVTTSHSIQVESHTAYWGLRFRYIGEQPWSLEAKEISASPYVPVNMDGSFETTLGRPGNYIVDLALRMDSPPCSHSSVLSARPDSFLDGENAFVSGHPRTFWLSYGPPRLIRIPNQPEVALELEEPKGGICLSVLDDEGKPVVSSQVRDEKRSGIGRRGRYLRLCSNLPLSQPKAIRRLADGTLGVDGLAPGPYTLSGSYTSSHDGGIYREWVLPEPVQVEVGVSTVDVEVTLVRATDIRGVVLNPSLSLRRESGQSLAVYAWMDRERTELLGHCRLVGDPEFEIASMVKSPLFLSVEAFPSGSGFCGPALEVSELNMGAAGYELSVP